MICWCKSVIFAIFLAFCLSPLNCAHAFNTSVLCKVVFTGPVLPNMVELQIREGVTTHVHQTSYTPTVHDVVKLDDEGRRLLIRNGEITGFLVGRQGKLLVNFETVKMPDISSDFWDRKATYNISSPDDPSYATPLNPVAIYRKSVPVDGVVTKHGLDSAILHKIFIKLPSNMKQGCSYIFSLDKLSGIGPFQLTYNPAALRSSVVHASQAGWRPDDEPKLAFVSLWLGDEGGLDLSDKKGFVVIDNMSGKQVMSGNITIAKPQDSFDDKYGKNFNFTTVWQADFSDVVKPGSYRICVQGVGCSWPVTIAGGVWKSVHVKALRVFYHQRSGTAIGPPWTSFRRPAAFIPGKDIHVYQSLTPLMATPNGFLEGKDNFGALVNGATSREVTQVWGGYFDAGDWDRRIQHLKVTRYLIDLFVHKPDFYDKLGLDIPESDNSIPDILDEAAWAADFFRRLQTHDGGVRGGIESGGHPYYGEASWQESHRIYAYAPGTWSSYLYAATAARLAMVLAGIDNAKSAVYRHSAIRAMQWAEKQVASKKGLIEPEVRDARNFAAVELFRLTGNTHFHEIFMKTTVFGGKDAPLRKYGSHDQAEAAWSYVKLPETKCNREIRANCLNAILKAADEIIAAQAQAGFRWAKRPWIPAFGGAMTSPDIPEVVWAWWLIKQRKYMSCIMLAMQYVLGNNPLNISFMTGVGYKYPVYVMNFDARITGQAVPEGITVLGPVDFDRIGGVQNPYYVAFSGRTYPDPLLWPVLETFWDVFWFTMMCEYSIEKMANNALLTGVLAMH
jgi:endoglucanase